ncbi:MAG: hypothetical protein AB8B58_16540 [Roseobacter sp.]
MSEIDVFQGRIMAALDRMAAATEALEATPPDNQDDLKTALEEEKTVNAQLSERVRVLAERQEQALAAMEARSQEAVARMEALDLELQRLRRVNSELQSVCEALRDANEEGVGEPHLINRAMVAELEAMKAMRKTEIAESDEIIAAMIPLLSGAADTPTTEAKDA